VFTTLAAPTRDLVTEALCAGTYASPVWGRSYRNIQILTIEDLLGGATIDMPARHGTCRQAGRVKGAAGQMENMFGEGS